MTRTHGRRAPRLVAGFGVALSLAGCGPMMRQVGAPLHVEPGPPTTHCEADDWVFLVPSDMPRDNALARRAPNAYRFGSGVGAYQSLLPPTLPVQPLSVVNLLGGASSPAYARHVAPVAPYRARLRAGDGLMIAGVAVILGGLVASSIMLERGVDDGLMLGVLLGTLGGGAALGLVGYSIVPEAVRMEALFRDHLFFPQEDDMREVARRVGAYNQATRARCGGAPGAPWRASTATSPGASTPRPP